MPPKKNAANPAKPAPEPVSVVHESGDPVVSAISIIDKKVRNLEKRRVSGCIVRVVIGTKFVEEVVHCFGGRGGAQ